MLELTASQLRRVCDPASLGFETTADLPPLNEVLGQPRAVSALAFGTSISSQGYNLFALGQPGSGKTTLIRDYLQERSKSKPVPPDLCYVYNFADSRRPLPLRLPPGEAMQFQHDMAAAVDELKTELTKAFETEEYTRHRDKVLHDLENQRRIEFLRMEQHAARGGFQLLKGPGGLALVPFVEGKPVKDEDFAELPPDEKERIIQGRGQVQHDIEEMLKVVREMDKAARDALRSVDVDTAAFATRHVIEELRARYREQPDVLSYLEALQADVTAHADDFRKTKEPPEGVPAPLAALLPSEEKSFARYQVNVLVNNADLQGSPVVVETNPTFHNLVGRIEHQTSWGGVFTDHTMIKPGALHRANGGYLIIPARECLLNPYAWEGLKRALKDSALRVEELGAQLSLMSTVTLDPQPVPLDVKVVLIGSPAVYYLLHAYDEDFRKLFKVKADFTTRMPRGAESEHSYALFVNTITRVEKTMPFDATAVARVVEYGSRAIEDQDRLSTQFGDIADLVREAAHLAGANSHKAVTAADVRTAEEARRYRQNLMEDRMQEMLTEGTVMIATEGKATGRINGLSVLSIGDYAFGHPVRLTATVAPGRRGAVSIEREVEMSGPIHGKGVLILNGYLLHKYGQSGPLSLSASLVFEQSYSMVDGDSASLAELCILLSAVSETPLRQEIAVTGSVNQHGDVQAVGGVTHKIEGFFDLCKARGLTGSQGVLIPAANRRHLMLRDDVVEAVANGKFHIWLAEKVDEALGLLTGAAAETVHRAVADRLAVYAESLRGSDEKHVASPAGAPTNGQHA